MVPTNSRPGKPGSGKPGPNKPGTNKQLVGDRTEQFAFEFLSREGLRPLRRNFRCRRGEIDLIMLDGDVLVFVEVRHRSAGSFVRAVHTVDARKQRKLITTASMFLAMNRKFSERVCRFDVVGVDRSGANEVNIEWLQDAFRPGT